ncbi:hypothetical protein N7450_004192 [Penicillium hetheringtonii]|uniref:FAD-binding FR-type domain-containing protein n=1 Tax=Penicillium hetheringtonii TaxID=911720 RepID=A0AAD6GVI6_9EURO|nr:hypothetical protein N7450_004192 [Penicillium hetheringtonii]
MAVALQGWHPGEVTIQRQLGFEDAVKDSWRIVSNNMPSQHRIFHTSNLNFIPVTTIDQDGRPWASIMAGLGGEIGFVQSPSARELTITAQLWDGDPLLDTATAWVNPQDINHHERQLIAGLGIELSTRRRNKFAGKIESIQSLKNSIFRFAVNVNEALGNCPKYINVRKLVPFPSARPQILYRVENLQPKQRLPQDVINFILDADTVFVGSIYKSERSTAAKFPSHAGMNARGGLPGFLRVSPSDGQTIVMPDYSGNRLLSTLGNIEATGLVAFTIVSFTTGDVLYLTGTAKNIVGQDALNIMRRQAALTVMKVSGFTFVKDAMPLRQQAGTAVERSPYSPKVKFLNEEPEAKADRGDGRKCVLESATQLSHDLAIFRFKIPPRDGAQKLRIRPGQAIALDFIDWIGPPQYRHMSSGKPSALNDDRVRTWTVSSAHENSEMTWFELTMREVQGGTVTGALFDILRESNAPYGSKVTPARDVAAGIVGVTGDFYLGQTHVNALWVAGGIGVTPFLSMLSALSMRHQPVESNITLALATREPGIMVKQLTPLLAQISPRVTITVDIFTSAKTHDICLPQRGSQRLSIHHGRIPVEYWSQVAENKDILICGPGGFGDSVVETLQAFGVPLQKIQREGFY